MKTLVHSLIRDFQLRHWSPACVLFKKIRLILQISLNTMIEQKLRKIDNGQEHNYLLDASDFRQSIQ